MIFGFLEEVSHLQLFPIALLVFGSLCLLLFSTVLTGARGERWLTALTFVFVSGALISLLSEPSGGYGEFGGAVQSNWMTTGFSAIVLLLLLAITLVLPSGGLYFKRNLGAAQCLLLLSASGGLLMAISNHLIVFFVGLELLSLPLYVLCGLNSRKELGFEAAFKYFLLGAISSTLLVYGSALIWGATGTLHLSELASAYAFRGSFYPGLALLGSTLFVAGLAFKLGLVPFHMWVPDVYEGAPTVLVAWMSGAVKAAVLPAVLQVTNSFLPLIDMDWSMTLSVLAFLSMLIGSLGALHQKSVKRMLAYSSIAHAGYIGIGLVVVLHGNLAEAAVALIYYTLSYGLATLGLFVILSFLEEGAELSVEDLSGLRRRRPGLAAAFSLLLFSLAGLPPLAGFVAKFGVFKLAIEHQFFALALAGVITSVISLGYYLALVVYAFMKEPISLSAIRFTTSALAVLSLAAIFIVLLGVLPSGVLTYFADLSQYVMK